MPLKGSKLVHPQMLNALWRSGFFPHIVQIQAKVESRTSVGGTTYSWSALPGMEAVSCVKYDRVGSEQRQVELIVELDMFTILLKGYYPAIQPDHRAVMSTGEVFDILEKSSDSQKTFTELTVRLVTPTAQPGV